MPSIPAPCAPSLLFCASDLDYLRLLVGLVMSNPFSRERIAWERGLLVDAYVDTGPAWCLTSRFGPPRENLVLIHLRLRAILVTARAALDEGAAATPDDLLLYQDACTSLLYDTYDTRLQLVIDDKLSAEDQKALFTEFRVEHEWFFSAARGRREFVFQAISFSGSADRDA